MRLNDEGGAITVVLTEQLASGASLDGAIDAVALCARRQAPHVTPDSPDWDRLWHDHFEAFDSAIASTIRAYALRATV